MIQASSKTSISPPAASGGVGVVIIIIGSTRV
jgi:hypothetical protein